MSSYYSSNETFNYPPFALTIDERLRLDPDIFESIELSRIEFTPRRDEQIRDNISTYSNNSGELYSPHDELSSIWSEETHFEHMSFFNKTKRHIFGFFKMIKDILYSLM